MDVQRCPGLKHDAIILAWGGAREASRNEKVIPQSAVSRGLQGVLAYFYGADREIDW
jgi:hypothetical protein